MQNKKTKINATLLLAGVGISSFGDFVYLVAINVLVLQLTGSAAAVAGLWIMGPVASILTKFWSGSLIDRLNKRRLMILTDVFRALLVAVIPFLNAIWLIYICLFFLSVAKAFFEPTSISYITGVIPKQQRKRFNSFRSLVTSGAFLVGPAIAGVLLMVTTASIAIWINAVSFLLSALFLSWLPNLEQKEITPKTFAWRFLRDDWQQVIDFSKKQRYVMSIYLFAQLFMVVALGMDAQEVVFTQQVLGLTEADFGLLISITGAGSIVGAATISFLAKKLSIRLLVASGYLLVAAGYFIYAFSFSFWSVAVGFIILGFFNAFSSTGLLTFYQNNVPLSIMGRITSVYGTLQSLLQIVFILLIGFTGDLVPLRYSIIAGSLLTVALSVVLTVLVYQPSQYRHFAEEAEAAEKAY
ncbi:MFS transporter [Sediminibacillus halophilus]|uniref:Major Facilitator Superfamily protein n=1 Tax=Sediminibacillus halophilus TaxID=482461 RepID=A0A1G9P5Y4_9BACI|nr:MFS transporter [Sediminibacillus halophilus]SDL94218.1 Major Facilitator Superfamily protein [Sediminibacillus halophilus]